ncbi:MAG TPA: glycosyltransferase family 4 protein [Gemmataceae bacterium]|jgi:glycosyltransferase involved in cell wall biosynthesis|nr:glycosyltransferase family 4 protein [Gemmataceae bacterium]
MRAAHYVQRYPPALGGSEAYFARLSQYLAAQNVAVTVFTSNAQDLEAFWSRHARTLPAGCTQQDGIDIERYPLLRFPGRRYLLKALSLFPNREWRCLMLPCNPISLKMWNDAKGDNRTFDVVHATALPYAWPIVCALKRARRLHIPFFVTPFLHLGDPENPHDKTRRVYLSPALLYLLQEADGVFVQTRLEQQALVTAGLTSEKTHLQGLGVVPAECTGGDRARARLAWHATEGEVIVGHLANQSYEKGTIDLLRAAQRAWQAGQRFRLVLAGPAMPNFHAFWQSFEWKQAVIQLGVLDEEQKRDFFAGIDIFALPSRSDSFGLVLLEAWANGCPNLAYRAGGIAEIIHHESDGLLALCGSLDQLATELTRLVGDAGLRQRLGAKGRVRVFTEFDWPSKLDLVRRVYEEAIEKKKSRE